MYYERSRDGIQLSAIDAEVKQLAGPGFQAFDASYNLYDAGMISEVNTGRADILVANYTSAVGTYSVPVQIPTGAVGRTVWLQAAERDSTTPVLRLTVQ